MTIDLTDEELCKGLRLLCFIPTTQAADRIEALTEQLNICRMAQVVMENGIAQVEGEFARAMKHVMDYSNDRHLVAFARDTLAEIESSEAVTLGEKG